MHRRKRRGTDGAAYEKHVARKMRMHLWLFVRRCGKATQADFGGDITALGFLFTKIVVQCKCYNKPVGVKAVMEVNAARRYYHASRAAVATNSVFTKQAKELARKCNVALWEHY